MTSAKAGQMSAYGALPVPRMTPELMGLVTTGTVYSLSVVWEEGIQVPGPMVPYTLSPRLRHGDPFHRMKIVPARLLNEQDKVLGGREDDSHLA